MRTKSWSRSLRVPDRLLSRRSGIPVRKDKLFHFGLMHDRQLITADITLAYRGATREVSVMGRGKLCIDRDGNWLRLRVAGPWPAENESLLIHQLTLSKATPESGRKNESYRRNFRYPPPRDISYDTPVNCKTSHKGTPT